MAAERPDSGKLLMEIALQFGATIDLDRLLPLVLARITELFSAERALFALFDPKGAIYEAVVHNLIWDGPPAPLPISQGLVAEVLQKGEPVLVADAEQDGALGRRQSVRILGLRFMIGVPVYGRGHDRVIGMLYTDSQASHDRDVSAEMELLVAVARLVGTAVENARLFEEQLFRHKLLSQTMHDFRGPLSVYRANAELLQMGAPADPNELQEIAADLISITDRLADMTEHALELSSIDHGRRDVEIVRLDLLDHLPRHVRQLATFARQRNVSTVLDMSAEPLLAHTVPDQVWIILDNLLFNAIKHSPKNGTIVVTARLRADSGPIEAVERPESLAATLFDRTPPLRPTNSSLFVEVTVQNGGPPIPTGLLPYLFQAYVRGARNSGGINNSGLGLAIVDQCARHLGGAVWVESDARHGTRFMFTLPTEARFPDRPGLPAAIPGWRDTTPLGSIETLPVAPTPSAALESEATVEQPPRPKH